MCRAVLRVSLRWLEHIEGCVRWSSAHRSISSVVVVLACKMTTNNSLTFLCHTLSVNVWYVPDSHILLLRMRNAYGETGLFVFIHRVFSLCLISTDLPVWPTYDLLHGI